MDVSIVLLSDIITLVNISLASAGPVRSPDGAVVNILPVEFFIVACTFARFHTFIIVNNYIDISRKMNYNRNLQSGQLQI